MKAKELAEELLKNPDFEVGLIYIYYPTYDDPHLESVALKVCGIADIGYSDKIILLDCE